MAVSDADLIVCRIKHKNMKITLSYYRKIDKMVEKFFQIKNQREKNATKRIG